MSEIGRARIDEVAEGGMVKVRHPPYDILLARIDGKLYAMEDACPHSGQSLCEGTIEGFLVTCPAHQWLVDIRSGRVLTEAGADRSNPAFRVTIEAGWAVVHDD